ncbi:MAG: isoprenoid biosynthesis glyoxalase ElbB [Flavobacteriales bacterium]
MAGSKIGVLLSGCGVFDGTEIHEGVFTLYQLEKNGAQPVCIAPDMEQHHVLDHRNGSELDQKRNVLVESARIARGDVRSVEQVERSELDGLAIPGGFGAAKNLTEWAFKGPEGSIREDVKALIKGMVEAGKPVGAVCMGPTVVAKALADSDLNPKVTVGTTASASPYDINGINEGVKATGASIEEHEANEMAEDHDHRIATAPCYNMEASIIEVHEGIEKVMKRVAEWAKVGVGA